MVIGDEILKYKEDIIKNICDLIKIRSVGGESSMGRPFGEDVYKALLYMLNLGESLGFKAKNVDGYAGHIEYGEGDEAAGVLVHLDVVPEGVGWTFPPFEGVISDGKIYGRGASDDKGPAVVAVYGLKVLKDLGIVPKRKVRIIFGTNEERGMHDIEYYFSKERIPDLGFSPDAGYPIINREKGILQIALTIKKREEDALAVSISELSGGEAVNMVPAESMAFIPESRIEKEEVLYLQELADKIGNDNIEVSYEMGKGIIIRSKGKSAHAASPQSGVNAIYQLLDFLYNAELKINDSGGENRENCNKNSIYLDEFLKFIYENKLGFDPTGETLGINLNDAESGALTINLGKIIYNQNEKKAMIDIRYPVMSNYRDIMAKISALTEKYGICAKIIGNSPPLYVPADHPIITKLSLAYEKITGEKANLIAIGGGTYARTLRNNGVAFGGAGSGAHQHDEHVEIEELMRHARICTQAIYEIAN